MKLEQELYSPDYDSVSVSLSLNAYYFNKRNISCFASITGWKYGVRVFLFNQDLPIDPDSLMELRDILVSLNVDSSQSNWFFIHLAQIEYCSDLSPNYLPRLYVPQSPEGWVVLGVKEVGGKTLPWGFNLYTYEVEVFHTPAMWVEVKGFEGYITSMYFPHYPLQVALENLYDIYEDSLAEE